MPSLEPEDIEEMSPVLYLFYLNEILFFFSAGKKTMSSPSLCHVDLNQCRTITQNNRPNQNVGWKW